MYDVVRKIEKALGTLYEQEHCDDEKTYIILYKIIFPEYYYFETYL